MTQRQMEKYFMSGFTHYAVKLKYTLSLGSCSTSNISVKFYCFYQIPSMGCNCYQEEEHPRGCFDSCISLFYSITSSPKTKLTIISQLRVIKLCKNAGPTFILGESPTVCGLETVAQVVHI